LGKLYFVTGGPARLPLLSMNYITAKCPDIGGTLMIFRTCPASVRWVTLSKNVSL